MLGCTPHSKDEEKVTMVDLEERENCLAGYVDDLDMRLASPRLHQLDPDLFRKD